MQTCSILVNCVALLLLINHILRPPLSCIPTKRTEEWWMQRHVQKMTDKTSKITTDKTNNYKSFDLIFIGDSIIHAWELEGEDAWHAHFGHLSTLNLGYAGDRTEHVLWRIEQGEIDSIEASYVVLLIGTNNAGHRHDKPNEIADGIKCIVVSITKKIPDCKIILTALFPRSRNKHKRMRRAVDETNDIIRKLANNHSVIWFDINQHFLDDTGVLHESVMPDLLHPNALQYEIWAKELTKFISAFPV
jgi:lysophospholipase L1-like esterase